MVIDSLLSLTITWVRIADGACETVASGLGLGGGFSRVSRFCSLTYNWLLMTET